METYNTSDNTARLRKFKSYYVVWKLSMHTQIISQRITFKSYYVVWKQISKHPKFDDECGLNRTMQYGNDII